MNYSNYRLPNDNVHACVSACVHICAYMHVSVRVLPEIAVSVLVVFVDVRARRHYGAAVRLRSAHVVTVNVTTISLIGLTVQSTHIASPRLKGRSQVKSDNNYSTCLDASVKYLSKAESK